MATINGTSGDDTLNGTSLGDLIFGFGGNDILNGNGGNDQLDGGIGTDTMSGGTGSDIYFVDDVGDSVIESSGQGNDEVRTTLAAYALTANVEKLRFTGSGSFIGTGNVLSNEIYGGGSNDSLYGGDGWDTLSGGGGDDNLYGGNDGDVLIGGTGDDYMEGNDGDDVYIVDSSGDTVVELSGEGIDHVYTALAVYALPDEVEIGSWNFGAGAIALTGNALDNTLLGSSYNDSLSGLDGDDLLRGYVGADTLSGGDGADLLVGGADADTLIGGADADIFRIGNFESGVGAAADSIGDFQTGVDLIDLSGWDANLNVFGDEAFAFIGGAAFSGTAGELRHYFDGTDTWVQGDTNGDAAADFEIFLNGSVSLSGPDFIL